MKKLISLFAAILCCLSAFANMSNSIEYSQVNIVGSAVEGGWDYTATPMSKISYGVFSWSGTLKGGEPFKFMNSTDGWHKHVVATTQDEVLNEGEIHHLDFYANWQLPNDLDNKFKVSETGEYVLTVDLMSMSVCLTKVPLKIEYPEKYYVTGSALNNEVIELTKFEGFEFKKVLHCSVGNVILMDTPTKSEDTRYFIPMFEDVDLTFGKDYITTLGLTSDYEARGWSISTPGDYTLYVSCANHGYQGRKYSPRKILFLVGGCCELSWNYWDNSNNQFIPNPYNSEELIWEGELKIGWDGDIEPEKFKILTAQDWMDETYHPYIADTYAENTNSIRTTDGEDSKWCIQKDGHYKITVNTKYETITTEYISPNLINSQSNDLSAATGSVISEEIQLAYCNNCVKLLQTPEVVDICIVDISGNIIANKERMTSGIVAPHIANGIYIVSISGTSINKCFKVRI